MSQQTERPRLLNIAEAAELLATNERHIRSLLHQRLLPYVKVGHLLRFDERELLAWIEGRKVAPTRKVTLTWKATPIPRQQAASRRGTK